MEVARLNKVKAQHKKKMMMDDDTMSENSNEKAAHPSKRSKPPLWENGKFKHVYHAM